MNAAERRAAAGRGDWLLWPVSLFGERAVSSPRPTFQIATRAASVKRERSNPQPRAAPYSEHGEACERRTLTGAVRVATLVVGGDVEADQAGVVRRFGLTGGGAAGSGLRRDGPSMRMVMQ